MVAFIAISIDSRFYGWNLRPPVSLVTAVCVCQSLIFYSTRRCSVSQLRAQHPCYSSRHENPLAALLQKYLRSTHRGPYEPSEAATCIIIFAPRQKHKRNSDVVPLSHYLHGNQHHRWFNLSVFFVFQDCGLCFLYKHANFLRHAASQLCSQGTWLIWDCVI